MTCIHGLDEINCPNCRILKSSLPFNSHKAIKTPELKIKNPFFKNDNRIQEKLIEQISTRKLKISQPSFNLISKPAFINEPPNFQNKIILDRAKELDISKDDNFGISKKIPLESPEWQFEEED